MAGLELFLEVEVAFMKAVTIHHKPSQNGMQFSNGLFDASP